MGCDRDGLVTDERQVSLLFMMYLNKLIQSFVEKIIESYEGWRSRSG